MTGHEKKHRRDRQAIFSLAIGVAGSLVTWASARLQPGEMLCIEQSTLVYVGVGMSISARILGEILQRLPPNLIRTALEATSKLLRR